MKTLKLGLPAILVGLALSITTLAGDMTTPGFIPPPPPPGSSQQGSSTDLNELNLSGLALEIWLSLHSII